MPTLVLLFVVSLSLSDSSVTSSLLLLLLLNHCFIVFIYASFLFYFVSFCAAYQSVSLVCWFFGLFPLFQLILSVVTGTSFFVQWFFAVTLLSIPQLLL